MKIDFAAAREAFERYLNGYDREDEKIKLKIVHTYGVVACAGNIAKRMGLNAEDRELARMIALLHDIGRFEQIRQYDSFQPDTMDHAAYGALLLFGEAALPYFRSDMKEIYEASALPEISDSAEMRKLSGMSVLQELSGSPMIREFIKNSSYDEIICQAIMYHSDFRLPEIHDEKILLHARLIRDADKLDNCRVKLVDSVEAMLGVPREEAGQGKISPKVWEACIKRQSVLSADRVSPVDYWVSYLAQYYELYFPETWAILLENDYISRIAAHLDYPDLDTVEKMKKLTQDLNEFGRKKLEMGAPNGQKKGSLL